MANEHKAAGDSVRTRGTITLKGMRRLHEGSGAVTLQGAIRSATTCERSQSLTLADDRKEDPEIVKRNANSLNLAPDSRLDERLTNWGNIERGRASAGDRGDAVLVDLAWRGLDPRYKEILRMHYVWRAHREVICRRLKIKRRPGTAFELELAHAKRAIRERLGS